MAKTDGVARIIALAALGKSGGSSTGGTTNYLELANKPKINNVELTGNKTLEDLGINIPELPIASADTLGGIKIGENLSIDENGVVSASGGNDIEIRTINIPFRIKSIISSAGGQYINVEDEEWIKETNKILNEIYQNQSTKKYLILFKDIDGIHGFKSFTNIPAYNSSGEKSFRVSLLFDCEYGNFQSIDNFTRYFFKFDLYFYTNIENNIVDIDQTKLTKNYNLTIVPQTAILGKGAGYRAIYLTNGAPLGIYNELSYTPTSDYNPATKKYVDDTITTAITTSLEGSY